jgi:hypothetical protein
MLLLALLTIAGCSSDVDPIKTKSAQAIESVLRADYENADRRKAKLGTDLKQAHTEYVESMRRIDLRDCPPDFRAAFLKHADAWGEMLILINRYDGFAGFLKSLTREPEAEEAEVRKQIRDTWRQVELIAMEHGAKTTP